jgi:hypothetical protein
MARKRAEWLVPAMVGGSDAAVVVQMAVPWESS